MENEHIIRVESLTKRFGDFIAVNNISFEVKKGEIFGFLGANGAGKTTAIRILTGLSAATSGKAIVAGYDVNENPEKVKKEIGYMSQKFSLYEDLTLKENITFYGGMYGMKYRDIKAKTKELVERFDLGSVQNELISSLPQGWKQKLAFSVAILHNPKIIFLDEPTSGVDPYTRRQFWLMMYEAASHGVTLFVTTHYMDEAEYCNRISIMVDGRIDALGSPSALREQFNAKDMDEVFRIVAQNKKT